MNNPLYVDFLARFKNASVAGRKSFFAPLSKFNQALAEVLKRHQYVQDFEIVEGTPAQLKVKLFPVDSTNRLSGLKIISKPGRRIYQHSSSLPWGKTSNSLIIVSTSSGLLSQREAVFHKLGGEVIAEIW